MGFALIVYNGSAIGVNASNTDLSAATDADFTQRNSHYTFTEPYRLHSLMLVGASVTRGRIQVPTLNAIGEFVLTQANRALQPPTNPQWDLLWPSMPDVPINEEFQIQVSGNLGSSTEINNCGVRLVTPGWTQNLPQGQLTIPVRASFTVTPTLNAWSGAQALTFSQSLRGGVYAVVGASLQGSNSAFFRLIFPRQPLYRGRKLRPGSHINTAVGDTLSNQQHPWLMNMGEWGRFHTFEPPQAEVFGTAANSTTYQLFMWLVYLGPDIGLLNSSMN